MFISFEGADGAGKSTQAQLLVRRLSESGRAARYVREPGGTPAGEELRRILKTGGDLAPRAELMMFGAARAELVEKVIRPALGNGEVVVADRFADSSTAYQAYGRGLPIEEVKALNRIATGGVWPDVTFLLDISVEDAAARYTGRDGSTPGARRFEDATADFHRRVVEGYRAIAKAEPRRWVVVDAAKSVDAVAAAIWRSVEPRLTYLTPSSCRVERHD
jgi:dTMP kinase